MKKLITILILFISTLQASFESVKVGNIDYQFRDKIDETTLKNIIYEIKDRFEAQLGYEIFDYQDSGKPIDIIYIAPSAKKLQIENAIKSLEQEQERIKEYEQMLLKDKDTLIEEKYILENDSNYVNNTISEFNNYVQNKRFSKDEYDKIKDKEKELKTLRNELITKQKRYNNLVNLHNKNIAKYNNAIRRYNTTQRKIEILSKSLKEIKGMAKGYSQKTIKQSYENGTYKTQTETKSIMQKIEIYGFESTEELKAILAHELCHLVGVGHLDTQRALMNPMLQKNQVENLFLTYEDIEAINSVFGK